VILPGEEEAQVDLMSPSAWNRPTGPAGREAAI